MRPSVIATTVILSLAALRGFAGPAGTQQKLPSRIVSLSPSNTEILFAIGAGEQVVGVTDNDDYPAEASTRARVGQFGAVDVERIVALEPDLILAGGLGAGRTVPDLTRLGLRVVVVDPQTVGDILNAIAKVGLLTGRSEQGASIVARARARIDAIRTKVAGLRKPTVFWELSSDLWSAGPGSYVGNLIDLAGGTNIATGGAWLQLSNEAVIAANPEVVLLADSPFGVTPDSVARRPGWSDVRAVVDRRVIAVSDTDLVSRPGPRVADALLVIARALHPEAFP